MAFPFLKAGEFQVRNLALAELRNPRSESLRWQLSKRVTKLNPHADQSHAAGTFSVRNSRAHAVSRLPSPCPGEGSWKRAGSGPADNRHVSG